MSQTGWRRGQNGLRVEVTDGLLFDPDSDIMQNRDHLSLSISVSKFLSKPTFKDTGSLKLTVVSCVKTLFNKALMDPSWFLACTYRTSGPLLIARRRRLLCFYGCAYPGVTHVEWITRKLCPVVHAVLTRQCRQKGM